MIIRSVRMTSVEMSTTCLGSHCSAVDVFEIQRHAELRDSGGHSKVGMACFVLPKFSRRRIDAYSSPHDRS